MVNITYYGHSTFMVEVNGKKILFDPFITGNEATKGIINLLEIVPDYILLSHGHEDHVLDVEMIAKQSHCPVIATFEVANWCNKMGIDNTIPMNIGGTINREGINIKMVNAVHTSSFPDGSYAGVPAGFVISWEGGCFYYSGDTALHYDMKLIAEKFNIDFAFLCLGDHFTMGVQDAIKAAGFVNTDKVIGMHFDTFPPIEIDHKKTVDAFKAAGLTLKLPEIGEIFSA